MSGLINNTGLSFGTGLEFMQGLGGAGLTVSAAFNPLSLQPIALWNPANVASLWKDTAGTIPVTADGDAVARIDDLSGNGNNLLQSTASSRPLWRSSGGLSWLEFDGVDDFFEKTTAVFGQMYVSIALRVAATGYHNVYDTYPGTNPMLWIDPSGRLEVDSAALVSAASVVGANHAVLVRHKTGTAVTYIQIDNLNTVTAAGATIEYSNNLTMFNRAGANTYNGRFYGAVFVKQAEDLSAANILGLRQWAGSLCGVNIS